MQLISSNFSNQFEHDGFLFVFKRRVDDLDKKINASGFIKEIEEFDKALEELEQDEKECNADENNNEESKPSTSESKCENNHNVNSKETQDQSNEACSHVEQDDKPDNDDVDEDEANDKLENLHEINKKYVPYRDKQFGLENQNEGGNDQNSTDDDDGDNFTSTSTIMDQQQVRAKVRRSLLSRLKKERRRLKNKGESSVITSRDRDIREDIKSYFE
jgi:hypothetical protein